MLPEEQGLRPPPIHPVPQLLMLLTVYAQCIYVSCNGQFNLDVRLVNDTKDFQTMSNAVLYRTLAWVINGSDGYMTLGARGHLSRRYIEVSL